MFIPLHDYNRLKYIKLQYVTLSIIAVNALVYLLVNVSFSEQATLAAVDTFGYTPAVMNHLAPLPSAAIPIPQQFPLVTYAFLHANFWHLAGNMLFLWVFGDNVEDALGHVRYLIFYLLCAIAAALFHGLLNPGSQLALIGASGAMSGVIGAYLLLHPRVRVWVLVLGRVPLPLPAWIPLTLWIALQFFMLIGADDMSIAFGAHIGGFFTGLILVLFMRRRGVPLFDRAMTAVGPAQARPAPDDAADPRQRRPWGRQ